MYREQDIKKLAIYNDSDQVDHNCHTPFINKSTLDFILFTNIYFYNETIHKYTCIFLF